MVDASLAPRAAARPIPQRRVILLGASNLARGISTVFDAARLSWGGPLEFIAALGHGRSYGMTSNVLGRELPAITDCGLWSDWDALPQVPTASLVTDIGNDLLYGADVGRISAWVRRCLERLAPRSERIVVTGLPVSSVSKIGDAQFVLMRSVLFPRSKLTLDDARRNIVELNQRVLDMATEFDASFVVPRASWYGWDPIHIRLTHWNHAWQEIFSPWRDGRETTKPTGSLPRWIRLRLVCPRQRRLFGLVQRRPQPALTWSDGTTVSFY